MNIAIFTHSYIPRKGGLEEVIKNLSLELLDRGHTVIIVVFTPDLVLKDFEFIEGIPTYRISVPFSILPSCGWQGVIDLAKFILISPRALIKSAIIIKKRKVQLMHVHFMGINAFYAWALSFFNHLPLLVTLHGFNVHVMPYLKRTRLYFVKAIFKEILKRAQFITACSDYLLNTAIAQAEFVKSKSCVIYNGVDFKEFNQNHAAPLIPFSYILCLGRLQAPFKGFDLALLAFKDILDLGYKVGMVIAGVGPDKVSYQKLAKILGIEKKVLFYGAANRAEVVNLFRNCEFFVMPSRVEPFGIVNLEAMACAKAVIASRTGGVPEVVQDNLTGLLVEPNSEEALANGIKKLLDDKEFRDKLGQNGQKKIAEGNFSWEISAAQYLEIYQKLL